MPQDGQGLPVRGIGLSYGHPAEQDSPDPDADSGRHGDAGQHGDGLHDLADTGRLPVGRSPQFGGADASDEQHDVQPPDDGHEGPPDDQFDGEADDVHEDPWEDQDDDPWQDQQDDPWDDPDGQFADPDGFDDPDAAPLLW